MTPQNLTERSLDLLDRWIDASEQYWYTCPDRPELGCYGTGYNSWGVQTNQKYIAAAATLGAMRNRDRATARALAALRFSLASHVSGDYHCTDKTTWGRTWISGLGIERMMFAIRLLDPHLTDDDRRALRRVLIDEAEWILDGYHRHNQSTIGGHRWASQGLNVPESNIWNGAILWRAASMYGDHPRADEFRERAHLFLVNSVSVPGDAENETVLAGKTVRERHLGDNFFPHYALDHHGYCNVGYMAICVSNAAMLHFDAIGFGWPAPETLYHHQADLWAVLRRMVFADGRLARIGGDTRLRYTYCQEYLLPSLIFAADRFGDHHALSLADRQLAMIEREAEFCGDGSFYSQRLEKLASHTPYYYTRVESDRSCSLAQLCVHLALTELPEPADEPFEASVSGGWHEPEYGAILHRTARRLVSVAWRGFHGPIAFCQSPSDGHTAEWERNLSGWVEVLNHRYREAPRPPAIRIEKTAGEPIDGGFVATGVFRESAHVELAEGWSSEDCIRHAIAYAALPDGRTLVGLQHAVTADRRLFLGRIEGMGLNLPNDLYNDFRRRIVTAKGETMIESPPSRDELVPLETAWINIEGTIGAIGLYGADQMFLRRSADRLGGPAHPSLYVERFCFGARQGVFDTPPCTVVLDVGWAVLADADPATTQRFHDSSGMAQMPMSGDRVRAVRIRGTDDNLYTVIANFSDADQVIDHDGQPIRIPSCQTVIIPTEPAP